MRLFNRIEKRLEGLSNDKTRPRTMSQAIEDGIKKGNFPKRENRMWINFQRK